MSWRMAVFCYLYADYHKTWHWVIAAQVVHMEADVTAYAEASTTYFPTMKRPEPWAKEVEIRLNKNPITGDYISLWIYPSTLEDMRSDSYTPNLTN